ncbi:MAG: sugar phosphate isomerase/epimerase [Fibrobacteres bacterium]|nr:sugar phosphate isomerase/epimerase [Fibrobacterota bacterium]
MLSLTWFHPDPTAPQVHFSGVPMRSISVARSLRTWLLVLMGAASATCAAEPKIALKGDFVPFGLCMSSLSAAEQVAMCQRIGYRGLGLADLSPSVVKAFTKVPAVAAGTFRIHSALWWITVNDTIDTVRFDGILDDAKKMDMAVWMVADGTDKRDTSVRKAVRLFHKAADRCKAKGVRLVIYPHLGCVVETADEAVAMLDSLRRLGHSEVRMSIHLCHELKAGHRDSLTKIVKRVAPYLALASVGGADSNTASETSLEYWSTAIMPLDRGTYDVRPYLQALSESGYAGAVEYHTYNLTRPEDADYDNHLERTYAKWQTLVDAGVSVRNARLRGGQPRAIGLFGSGIPDGRHRQEDIPGLGGRLLRSQDGSANPLIPPPSSP